MFSIPTAIKPCLGMLLTLAHFGGFAAVYDIEHMAQAKGLHKSARGARARLIEGVAARMQSGDVLLLPRTGPVGDVDLCHLPDRTTVEFGQEGNLYLGARTIRNVDFNHVKARIFACDRPSDPKGLAKQQGALGTFENCRFFKVGQISNANYANSAFLGVEAARGARVIDIDGGTFTNCAVLYVWYHYMDDRGPYIYMDLNGGGAGSRIYQIVEQNTQEANTSVEIKRAKGLTLGVGDTESSCAPAGVWSFQGCENTLLVAHRDFKSHTRTCQGLGYMMVGGKNNKFYYAYNIGDPADYSLKVTSSPGLQLWGFFGEDKCDVPSDALKCFYTAEGMKYERNAWSEPMMVDKEMIWDYDGYSVSGTEATPSSPPSSYEVPPPPDVPALNMPTSTGKYSGTLAKRSASWGSKAKAMGLDISGRQSASEILQTLIQEDGDVELPEGTLLITRPLRPAQGKPTRLRGAGKGRTVLKAAGEFPILDLTGASLAKCQSVSACTPATSVDVLDLTLDGGSYGAYIDFYRAGVCWTNLDFRNQTEAGIFQLAGTEFDQHQFYHCTFTNTGKWGVRIENNMIDKQCFFDCEFTGQTQAGISCPNTHMFAGSIAECRFSDIDGPGVELGWCRDGGCSGYTPHQSMIMECTFEECGNETRPAIDWSWMESGMIAHTTVTIKNKKWKYGILGTGQIFHKCSVDVDVSNMVDGGAAFGVRSTRAAKNARPTGNIMKYCWSNGPLEFVFDEESPVKLGTSGDGYNHAGLKWWQSLDNYPWSYPQLIYQSSFSNHQWDYTLLRTDRSGNILAQVDFQSGSVHQTLPGARALARKGPQRWQVFDVRGRSVAVTKHSNPARLSSKPMSSGLYMLRPTNRGDTFRRAVMTEGQ